MFDVKSREKRQAKETNKNKFQYRISWILKYHRGKKLRQSEHLQSYLPTPLLKIEIPCVQKFIPTKISPIDLFFI